MIRASKDNKRKKSASSYSSYSKSKARKWTRTKHKRGFPPKAAPVVWTWPWVARRAQSIGVEWCGRPNKGILGAGYPLHQRGPRRQLAIWEVTPPSSHFTPLTGRMCWKCCRHRTGWIHNLQIRTCDFRTDAYLGHVFHLLLHLHS